MATMRDVAKKANTSVSTTSIVLNGKGDERHISKATQEKVFASASELNYKPSVAARRLRKGDTGSIVILIFWAQDFRASMIVRFLHGLQDFISQTDKTIELMFHFYTAGQLNKSKEFIDPSICSAAIICNTTSDDLSFLHETKLDVPIVLYNRESSRYCTVNVNASNLGVLPAKAFLKRAFKNYVILTGNSIFPGVEERENAFVQTLLEHGITKNAIQVYSTDNTMQSSFEQMELALKKSVKPLAVFCTSDNIAIGAVRSIHKNHMTFNEDVSLISIGNGDPNLEEFLYPSLSVVHLPMEKMATSCMSLAIELLNKLTETPHSIHHKITMIFRESYEN